VVAKPFASFVVGFSVSLSRFSDSASRGDELGNAHEIVGDEIEHEVGRDGCDASMFGLAHRAVLFAPAEDAFSHFAAGLRDLVADVAGRARIDRTAAPMNIECLPTRAHPAYPTIIPALHFDHDICTTEVPDICGLPFRADVLTFEHAPTR
jgi:hypothetical protein